MSQVAHEARAYPGLSGMRELGVYIYYPLDGMLPFYNEFAGTHIYIHLGGERPSVLPKNTAQCPRPRLKPDPLTPESQVH